MDEWQAERALVPAAIRSGAQIIGGWFLSMRLERRWTQRQLAWRCQVSQSTISRLETGRLRGMRLSTMAIIAAVLNGSKFPTYDDEPRASRRRLPSR